MYGMSVYGLQSTKSVCRLCYILVYRILLRGECLYMAKTLPHKRKKNNSPKHWKSPKGHIRIVQKSVAPLLLCVFSFSILFSKKMLIVVGRITKKSRKNKRIRIIINRMGKNVEHEKRHLTKKKCQKLERKMKRTN